MSQKLANNALALLNGSILAADTSITIDAATADLFPVADTDTDPVNTPGSDWFKVTLEDSAGEVEIVYVRTRASSSPILSNCIRGQEGTTALNFANQSICELRITALDVENAIAGVFGNISTSGNAAVGGNLTVGGTMSQAGVAGGIVPVGGIIMWSGTIATIPANWALCDGSNSTPDLRDKFIIGATADSGGAAKTNVTGAATQTGGSKDAVNIAHTHTTSATGTTNTTGSHSHTATDSGHVHANGLAASNNNYGAGGSNGTLQGGGLNTGSASANISVAANGSHSHTVSTTGTAASSGVSGTNLNLPPYYALAFIRRQA